MRLHLILAVLCILGVSASDHAALLQMDGMPGQNRAISTISIGTDHGGVNLKNMLRDYMSTVKGVKVIDRAEKVDASHPANYPDQAIQVGNDVVSKAADFGVMICTSGIGICIAVNKVKGIRATHIQTPRAAETARRTYDANVYCIGEKYLPKVFMQMIMDNAYLPCAGDLCGLAIDYTGDVGYGVDPCSDFGVVPPGEKHVVFGMTDLGSTVELNGWIKDRLESYKKQKAIADYEVKVAKEADSVQLAHEIGLAVAKSEKVFGILSGETGLANYMAVNKVPNARAVHLGGDCENMIRYARVHNNANVAVYGEEFATKNIVMRTMDIIVLGINDAETDLYRDQKGFVPKVCSIAQKWGYTWGGSDRVKGNVVDSAGWRHRQRVMGIRGMEKSRIGIAPSESTETGNSCGGEGIAPLNP